jgi:hypothetical protein
MVLELKAPDETGILGALASLAHGDQLCGQLPPRRHYLNQPSAPP